MGETFVDGNGENYVPGGNLPEGRIITAFLGKKDPSLESRIEIVPITEEYMARRIDDFSGIEYNWAKLGEVPWPESKFTIGLPLKWKLSFAAEDKQTGGRLAGYIICSCPEESKILSRVNKVVVDEPYWGNGIAGALLNRYLEECRNFKIPVSELKVLPTNSRAINLYEAAGYRKVGEAVGDEGKTRLVYQNSRGGGD